MIKFNIRTSLLLLSVFYCQMVTAGGNDDPLLYFLAADHLETNLESEELTLEAEGWIGKDLEKLWVEIEAEADHGELEELQLQLLYHRALSPYWNLRLGARHDFEPTPDQSWIAVGVAGLAPYFIDTKATLFWGEQGQTEARLELEAELMLTQRWVIMPELEIGGYGRNQEQLGRGSGISHIEASVRLGYQLHRQLVPYLGFIRERHLGNTADMTRSLGEATGHSELVLGFEAWF